MDLDLAIGDLVGEAGDSGAGYADGDGDGNCG